MDIDKMIKEWQKEINTLPVDDYDFSEIDKVIAEWNAEISHIEL